MDPNQPGSDYVGPTGPAAFIRVPSGIEHPVRPLPVLGSGGGRRSREAASGSLIMWRTCS